QARSERRCDGVTEPHPVKFGLGGLNTPTARASRESAGHDAGCPRLIRIAPALRGRTTNRAAPEPFVVAWRFTPAPRTSTVIPATGCPWAPCTRTTRTVFRPTTKRVVRTKSFVAHGSGGVNGPVVVVPD